jgi:hypothetical protein
MKTPIAELFEKYGHLLPDVENEYLEKEKKLIEEAFENGFIKNNTSNRYISDIEAQDYYNQKYKI